MSNCCSDELQARETNRETVELFRPILARFSSSFYFATREQSVLVAKTKGIVHMNSVKTEVLVFLYVCC